MNLPPSLSYLVKELLLVWPEHQNTIDRNLKSCSVSELLYAEKIANMIQSICHSDTISIFDGYKWMCKMISIEELHFRRHDRYRNSSFNQVVKSVYNDPDTMGPYMDGLLLSQALWSNHIKVGYFFINSFIRHSIPRRRHLEIGPGHGLLMALASEIEGSLYGWDVSQDSIEKTRNCLNSLNIHNSVDLVCQDLFKASTHLQYDDIVISEVLEHIENPKEALKMIFDLTKHGGRIFVNVPVNAPTIDHIYLFREPEEIVRMVESAGYKVEDTLFCPAAGYDEVTARKIKSTISCAIIARKIETK